MSLPWKSPLEGYENAPTLPTAFNADGKSLVNPPTGTTSKAYEEFLSPIDASNNGLISTASHSKAATSVITINQPVCAVYYMPTVEAELKYAKELHERIRREFPELRIYRFWERPVGPHPTAMFEVNTFTPHQTGAFFSWLTVHRGPCSVLIHPNTDDAFKDHTELMSWMGRPWPLNTEMLKNH